jgi:outer membrane protein assembly factor BamE (lipoprotein component of BamABCDE complex)
MRYRASLIGLLCQLLMAGCAAAGVEPGGQGPDLQTLSRIVTGQTTSAQVRELLGPPLRVTRFDRMQRDVWEYRRYENPTDERMIAVQFSGDGVVREVIVLKDYNREPCGP